jgi:two-component system, NtrC family, sensor histidine kinase HydH
MTMDHDTAEEKIKPFRLVKYFTLSSLMVIFFGTIVLSVLNMHLARRMQRQKSEDYARVLIENLNHQVFLQFIIPVVIKFGKIQLRNPEQFERMDKVVRSTFHSFDVEMVNIYDLDNTVSYSFDKDLIGKENVGGTTYHNALSGSISSKLVQRGNFFELLFGFPKQSLIVTFAPLRAEKPLSALSGPVLGVVEIVQDISKDYHAIVKFQVLVISTITFIMCLIFLVMLFIVKRGERIISQRALERLKLEEKLNRAKHLASLGEMTAGISHEIRNPLGIIKSCAEHLKKKMASLDPSNAIPDMIIEESVRLNNIITDFLNYAKPRTPHFLPCQVEEIIEKNLAWLKPQLEENGHIVKKYYIDHPPQISGDPDMLYQAFLNILLNAMQAMPGGGEIQIEINVKDRFLSIIFEDEGEGITPENLEKIWDPFFTTKDMGTGLGLGIVKNIIESHEGRIVIQSNTPLRGTKVIVELPVRRVENGNHFDRR